MKKALVILFDKVEEIEALSPIDILRRARVDVTTVSLSKNVQIIGRSGIGIDADMSIDNLTEKNFDAVILPGGPGVFDILDEDVDFNILSEIFNSNFKSGNLVAAICAAPVILKEFGLTNGMSVTCHDSVVERFGASYKDENVVVDANLITSKGAGTSIDFALAILEMLLGKDKASEISASICYKRQ